MGFTTPFKSFSDVKSDNPLVQAAVEDQNSDKTAVSWNFTMMPSEEWKNQLGSALLEMRRHRRLECRQDRICGRLEDRIRRGSLIASEN